jgi:hypothetical protein
LWEKSTEYLLLFRRIFSSGTARGCHRSAFCRYFSKSNNNELLERVPLTFLLIGGIAIVFQLLGSSLLFEVKKTKKIDENLIEPLSKKVSSTNSLGVW